MRLKWTSYKYLLLFNLLLSLLAVSFFYYSSIALKIQFQAETLLLFAAVVIIVVHAVYFLWLLNNRFPAKGLTSFLEGGAYTLNVFICFSIMYILFYVVTIVTIFIEKGLITLRLYKSPYFIAMILFLILAICSVVGLVLSFKLLSFLNKNRQTILHEIGSIGQHL